MKEWRDFDKNDNGKNGRAVDGNVICGTEKTIGLISGYDFLKGMNQMIRFMPFIAFGSPAFTIYLQSLHVSIHGISKLGLNA